MSIQNSDVALRNAQGSGNATVAVDHLTPPQFYVDNIEQFGSAFTYGNATFDLSNRDLGGANSVDVDWLGGLLLNATGLSQSIILDGNALDEAFQLALLSAIGTAVYNKSLSLVGGTNAALPPQQLGRPGLYSTDCSGFDGSTYIYGYPASGSSAPNIQIQGNASMNLADSYGDLQNMFIGVQDSPSANDIADKIAALSGGTATAAVVTFPQSYVPPFYQATSFPYTFSSGSVATIQDGLQYIPHAAVAAFITQGGNPYAANSFAGN